MNSNGNGHSAGGFINRNIPNLPLCEVYARVNPRGRRYLVGRVGTLKLLIMETDGQSKGERVWQACFWPGAVCASGPRRWRVRSSKERQDDNLAIPPCLFRLAASLKNEDQT